MENKEPTTFVTSTNCARGGSIGRGQNLRGGHGRGRGNNYYVHRGKTNYVSKKC